MNENKYKKKILGSIVAAMFMLIGLIPAAYAHDEYLDGYTMDGVIVEADEVTDQFGNVITEQSYYRTGGDVKVITRDEIEKRNYKDINDALRRIPGVDFISSGYRGNEYGFSSSFNGIAINGDTRVIVLIDGRRIDNATSELTGSNSYGSNPRTTNVNFDNITNIENIERIEVIKGPGASIYGSDAVGGVINIITRKGGKGHTGSIDLSGGSWGRQNYIGSYSGSFGKNNPLRVFVSGNHMSSDDTKYKDGYTGTIGTLKGSNWKENGLNFRVDKDFSKTQSIKVWFNYQDSKDGYPITTPLLRYWNEDDWYRIVFHAAVGVRDENNVLVSTRKGSNGTVNPGYSNIFVVDGGMFKGFSRHNTKDWDVVYTFNKQKGMNSFVRYYEQSKKRSHSYRYVWGHYDGRNGNDQSNNYRADFPNGGSDEDVDAWIREHLVPFPDNEEASRAWVEKTGGITPEPTSWRNEKNRGVQLQYAKSINFGFQHDIITSATYDRSKNFSERINTNTGEITASNTERNSLRGFVQDKIHVTDKLEITPAIRYSWYSSFNSTNTAGETTKGRGSTKQITPVVNSQYKITDTLSAYGGWTRIFRPIRRQDYTAVDGVFRTPLEDEKGNAWTMGGRKEIGDTIIGVNYNWTLMSNAIARLPIYDVAEDVNRTTAVNAREDRKALNFTADHRLTDNLTISGSYSYTKNTWKAKPGWILDPEWGYSNLSDLNLMINRVVPKNRYGLNISYDRDNLYIGLLTNLYGGMDKDLFSSNRFIVHDFNMSYQFIKGTTAYMRISNLSNEAYQTTYYARGGPGAAAMPSRAIVVGIKQKLDKNTFNW